MSGISRSSSPLAVSCAKRSVIRVSSLVVHEVEARQRLLELNDVQRRMTEVIGHVEGLLLRMERGTPGARARWN
ncbi:MAG: hypothetical protein ACE5I9_06155 [Candidatus Methylomirabilales bacterium]